MMCGRLDLSRLWILAAIAAVHFGTYIAVTRTIDRMPAAALYNWEIWLDPLIPHLPWSWPGYWAAYPLVLGAGGAAMLRLPQCLFWRAVRAFLLLILAAAVLHLSLPAPAPWPDDPFLLQRIVHESPVMRRWATFPSMHVALCTLTLMVSRAVFPSSAARLVIAGVTLAVGVSSLTLKEHVIVDALGGALLGGTIGLWWRRHQPSRVGGGSSAEPTR